MPLLKQTDLAEVTIETRCRGRRAVDPEPRQIACQQRASQSTSIVADSRVKDDEGKEGADDVQTGQSKTFIALDAIQTDSHQM